VCQCRRYQHQCCGVRVSCTCHESACQGFSFARPLSFRTWTTELAQRVLECWSGRLSLISISPPRRRALGGSRRATHTHAHIHTHNSNHHQVRDFGTCSGGRVPWQSRKEEKNRRKLIDSCPGIWFAQGPRPGPTTGSSRPIGGGSARFLSPDGSRERVYVPDCQCMMHDARVDSISESGPGT
jgi:hypothetical protein